MKITHLVVAASAAAILAGSSMTAFASGFSVGKSESSVFSTASVTPAFSFFGFGPPVPSATTIQQQSNDSISVNGGGKSTASAGTIGGSTASVGGGFFGGGASVSASGATFGSSSAGGH